MSRTISLFGMTKGEWEYDHCLYASSGSQRAQFEDDFTLMSFTTLTHSQQPDETTNRTPLSDTIIYHTVSFAPKTRSWWCAAHCAPIYCSGNSTNNVITPTRLFGGAEVRRRRHNIVVTFLDWYYVMKSGSHHHHSHRTRHHQLLTIPYVVLCVVILQYFVQCDWYA